MFWKAKPYRNQITGILSPKIHQIDETDHLTPPRTICGKECANYPGDFIPESGHSVDCRKCLQSIESTIRSAELQDKWKAEALEREAERTRAARLWWEAYDRYLQSPIWAEKRRLVLRRANGICEACGIARATQIHHRLYPSEVLPGSAEWIAAEKLFDLAAVCIRCHADLHPDRIDLTVSTYGA